MPLKSRKNPLRLVKKYPLGRSLFVIISFILVYGIGLIPTACFFSTIIHPLLVRPPSLVNSIYLGLGLVTAFVIFDFSEVIVTSFFIRLFKLGSTEGVADISLKDPKFYRFVLFQNFYNPIAMLNYFLHMYTLKEFQLRLLGAKIGKNVTLGGRIDDPSLFEIGDESVVGGMCEVLSHSAERGKLIFKKVKIGKKCTVGQSAIVLPGVVMEDGSIVGAMSLVPKNKRIPKGEVWGGVPVKKIK